MNYDSLIRNWHSKASEEDYFSKFVFEYLAFIAYLKKKEFPDCRSDRDAIQKLKQDSEIKMEYIAKIQSKRELKTAWENITAEFCEFRLGNASGSGGEVEEIKWWNCSHLNLYDQTPEERDKIKGVILNLDDWENMVEFWYAIRNNLFHGAKDPEDRRDQILIQNGYVTLRELVEIFLTEEER